MDKENPYNDDFLAKISNRIFRTPFIYIVSLAFLIVSIVFENVIIIPLIIALMITTIISSLEINNGVLSVEIGFLKKAIVVNISDILERVRLINDALRALMIIIIFLFVTLILVYAFPSSFWEIYCGYVAVSGIAMFPCFNRLFCSLEIMDTISNEEVKHVREVFTLMDVRRTRRYKAIVSGLLDTYDSSDAIKPSPSISIVTGDKSSGYRILIDLSILKASVIRYPDNNYVVANQDILSVLKNFYSSPRSISYENLPRGSSYHLLLASFIKMYGKSIYGINRTLYEYLLSLLGSSLFYYSASVYVPKIIVKDEPFGLSFTKHVKAIVGYSGREKVVSVSLPELSKSEYEYIIIHDTFLARTPYKLIGVLTYKGIPMYLVVEPSRIVNDIVELCGALEYKKILGKAPHTPILNKYGFPVYLVKTYPSG